VRTGFRAALDSCAGEAGFASAFASGLAGGLSSLRISRANAPPEEGVSSRVSAPAALGDPDADAGAVPSGCSADAIT
jgi:hypothetical protein